MKSWYSGKILSLTLLWLTLTSTAPFIFYKWPGHPYKILTFFCLTLMFFLLVMRPSRRVFDPKLLWLFTVQILFYIVIGILYKDGSSINLCIQILSLFLIIAFINSFIGFLSFVNSFIYAILAMGLGGSITFFAHMLVGLEPLFSVKYSAHGISYYLGLTTTNVFYGGDTLRYMRYAGFFDETGAYALYSVFALLLNKIYLQNRRIEILLIISTLFCFSLAYYVSICVYFLLFYLNKANVKYLLIFASLIFASYYYLQSNIDNATVNKIYGFTFKRFEINEKGLVEDNRKSHLENDKSIFLTNPLFGAENKKLVSGANFFSIFAYYGLVGSLFYYGLLILLFIYILSLRRRKTFFLKIFFIILLSLYHRPELSSVFTSMVFISMIYYFKDVPTAYLEQNMSHSNSFSV